ncbi:MAG: hypothetical protein JO063_14870 [Pseudonocardiales bacterium]|nr:hypothetical protein [Pseudonocardiales bacterium]MBV9031203.1 hypothetical protein [Pseudonocardiales bacterium]MBW0011367.1 hypothetical protein [Pseudonocardiales bacterium]
MSDLSEAFGRPAAAQVRNLGDLLPPRPRPVASPAEPLPPAVGEEEGEPGPEPANDAAVQPPPESPRRATAPSRWLRSAPEELSRSQSFQVAVYVLPEVKPAARRHRARDNSTNADVAFDAIDATFPELQRLLGERHTRARSEDSLFPSRHQRARRQTLKTEGRRVLWAIQATAEELDILDGLVAELGAESRSELVAAAVEAHLLTPPRR